MSNKLFSTIDIFKFSIAKKGKWKVIKSDQLITFDHFDHFWFSNFFKKSVSHSVFVLCSLLQLKQSKPTRGLRSENEEASRNFEEHLEKGERTIGAALKKVPTQKPALKKAAKGKVNSKNLKKLGEVSLKKVEAIAEEHSDEEAGALVLVQTMTKAKKSNAWNQHMASLRKDGNESLKKDFEQLTKSEKGKATALFLMQKHKPVFGSVSKSASKKNSLRKREEWMSEKEAYWKWSEHELKLHLDSGRVLWRECPDTWGVNEYLDTKDYEKTATGQSTSHWQYGQEYEVVDEEMEGWEQALERDLQTLMLTGLEKGDACLEKGKGKGKGLEKGKGKGRGKPKPIPNKGEEEDPLEDFTQEEALKKVRKGKALLLNTMSNFEEAFEKGWEETILEQAEPER